MGTYTIGGAQDLGTRKAWWDFMTHHPWPSFKGKEQHPYQKMHHDLKVFSSKLRGMGKTGCGQVEQQQKKDSYLVGWV
jgi:hypothetical protein